MGAISFFREELERAARIRGQHATLAPHIQRFLEEVLFGQRVDLYDPRVVGRLSDPDVREHIRATFLPLILKSITRRKDRLPEEAPRSVTAWAPFQATHSERRPTESSARTAFNLVPCDNQLEVAMTQFLSFAGDVDVAAFAKNSGPQALRIDYLNAEGRRATYTPDFLIRKTDGQYLLSETKGRADRDVAAKARAAVEWCKAASSKKVKWEYLYVPEKVFEQVRGNSVEELARACAPALVQLLKDAATPQLALNFEAGSEERLAEQTQEFIDAKVLASLPSRYRKAIEHAVALFHFHKQKEKVSFGPIFQPLLGPIDHAAEALMLKRLGEEVPSEAEAQKHFFEPDMARTKKSSIKYLTERANTLKKLLVYRSPLMPTGALSFCFDYAAKVAEEPLPGIYAAVRGRFAAMSGTGLPKRVREVYDFRNTYIAHEKVVLKDAATTREALGQWIDTLVALHEAAAS